MILRFLIVTIIFAIPAGVIVWVILKEAESRATRKRREKYGEWVKTISSMNDFDRTLAQAHIVRILREGPQSSYHGPWEDT